MSAVVFDGKEFAAHREAALAETIRGLQCAPRMGSVVFVEDEASMMYINLKRQAAVRVGIEFSVEEASLKENVNILQEKVRVYSQRDDLHGVLVQKPTKATWSQYVGGQSDERFDAWWHTVVLHLNENEDVDCLTVPNLERVYAGQWKILPATVKAVVSILVHASENLGLLCGRTQGFDLMGHKVVVIGRSEIVGTPLAAVLRQYGATVKLYGRDLDYAELAQAEVVVSATGQEKIVTGDMIKQGAIVIDVGSPKGDVEQASAVQKAAFLSPVPGGVGPVTVVSLLENLIDVIGGL